MTGQRAPRPLPLPRPPPRRPHPRPPAPGRESAAGRPDPPQGPEAGGARVQGPGEGPPAARRLQVQSIDTALSGEGAPSLSLSPGGRAALARAPAWPPTPLSAAAPPGPPHSGGGWRERPVGGQVGRRGRRGPGAEPRWREPVSGAVLEARWGRHGREWDAALHSGPAGTPPSPRLPLTGRLRRIVEFPASPELRAVSVCAPDPAPSPPTAESAGPRG